MKKENFSKKIRKAFLFIAPMLLAFVANAKTINCNSVDCIKDAMENAQPGDEIVIAPGTYATSKKVKYENEDVKIFAYFVAKENGTPSNPITLRGASSTNKPVLTSTASGEMFMLAGDHWIIKDLEIKNGKRCILTDLADNNQLINLTVSGSESEGIHFRNNSNNNLVKNCTIFNTGTGDGRAGYGEGIYIGSSKNQHSQYSPKSDNNIIEGCTIGPDVSAEGVDVKEGTNGTIIRDNTFFAKGISGENFSDALIDIKGSTTSVYKNIFNQDGSIILNSIIDLQQPLQGDGYRNAIFDNTINLDDTNVATARKKQGNANLEELHIWDNTRTPASKDYPDVLSDSDDLTNIAISSCPSWNIVACNTLSTSEFNQLDNVTLYPNPVQERFYVSGIPNNAPVSVAIMTLQGQVVSRNENVILGTQGVDISNLTQGMYVIQIKNELIAGTKTVSIK